MSEFLSIAWPGLLVLAGYLALIVHAARAHRRRHPRARYSIRYEGPRGVLIAEQEMTEAQLHDVAVLARGLVGWRDDRDEGRALASRRDDLIAQGVDPRELLVPLAGTPDATTSAHSRGLHRGEHADPDCFHCAVRDGTADRWPG